MPDDAPRDWMDRVRNLPSEAFVPLGRLDATLARDLERIIGETIARAAVDWGVEAPSATIRVAIAAPDALLIAIGDDALISRWSGNADDARQAAANVVWQLADHWPAPNRGKRWQFNLTDSEGAWATGVFNTLSERLATDLETDDGPVGLQIALELVHSLSRYGRSSNHSTVSGVLARATPRQLFFAVYSLAMLACEEAPSTTAIEQLYTLAHDALPWRD